MRPDLGRAVLVLLLALTPFAAQARWYQVEVVVFRNAGDGDGEHFAAPDALPDFRNTVELITDLPDMDDEPPPVGSASLPVAFEALAPAERRLAGVARRLRNSGGYEVLLARAWRQPSFGVSRARRVYLSDVELSGMSTEAPDAAALRPARRAEGIVSIKVSRLLHVEVDFLLYHEGTPVRLSETRKVKLREIHYFDHPLFGVIVQVSPWVRPDEPDEAGDAVVEQASAD